MSSATPRRSRASRASRTASTTPAGEKRDFGKIDRLRFERKCDKFVEADHPAGQVYEDEFSSFCDTIVSIPFAHSLR